MKKLIILLSLLSIISQWSVSFAAEDNVPTYDEIYSKALEFASQYPYKTGDVENSFSYDVNYTSGFEKRTDGTEYECPAIYQDSDATFANDFELKMGEMSLYVNGQKSIYGNKCVLCNSITLVPYEVFSELGCNITYTDEYYLTTISNDYTILEIIPYMIGMRKDKAEGYYVPLNACARYVDGELYVPLRAIAEELGVSVGWDGVTHSVILTM